MTSVAFSGAAWCRARAASQCAPPLRAPHAALGRRANSAGGAAPQPCRAYAADMIRKLKSGEFRLYSRKLDPKTGRRRNLGTFATREAAEKHERAVQYFKHQH
jgi:hypothetical protein